MSAQIQAAEKAAQKTAERLRRARLQDAEIRERAAKRTMDRLQARIAELTVEMDAARTGWLAVKDEVIAYSQGVQS